MQVRFKCTTCSKVSSANARLLGRTIRCPACGGSVVLPSKESVEAASAQKKQDQEEERRLEIALDNFISKNQYDFGLLLDDIPSPYGLTLQGSWDDRNDEKQRDDELEEKRLAASTATFTRPKKPQSDDMDMTPMVDVTFLLLIFFMITASFSVQKSIQRPAARDQQPSTQQITEPEQDNDSVTVQVDEFNAYNVLAADWDRVASNKQDLIVALTEAHQSSGGGRPPEKLIVQAHENCIHAAVIDALDAGKEADFAAFEVVTVEQFD